MILEQPLTHDRIREQMKHGYITGVVEVGLEQIIQTDLVGFCDLVSELLVGNDLLMDISWQVVGHGPFSVIHLEVTGDPSAVLEIDEEGIEADE